MDGRRGLATLLLAAALTASLMAGCTEEHPAPPPTPPSAVPTQVPAYDGSLPPARSVLALVPLPARSLRLVDWAEIRKQVGLPELTSRSSAADRAAFRMRAARAAPLFDPPVLGAIDGRLRAAYGFGVDDVAWEAQFSGGGSGGWVLAFAPGVDMHAVARAVRDGVGRLRGARVDVRDRLVTDGIAAPHQPVWGSDPTWRRLVPAPGEAVVVHRGCVGGMHVGAGPAVEPLSGFSITFGDHVATVRMDRNRDDLFARVRLGRGAFGRVFRTGVADPSTGRIGYDVPHPAQAVPLVRHDRLPVAACAPAN